MAAAAGASSSASASRPAAKALKLNSNNLGAFKISKLFGAPLIDAGRSVTSVGFDDRGDYLVSASDDDKIHIWDCNKGRHVKTLYSKKYGVHLARFTHKSTAVIYASNKEDDTIRHHSLIDNTYLQYYRGHKSRVTSLQMSPIDDTFLSAAKNEAVRFWDLRTPQCQAMLPVQGHPVIAYDASGRVFAIALNERPSVSLYDVRNFTARPFLVIPISDDDFLSQFSMPPRMPVIASLAFNPNGLLLVGTAGDVHYVLESFNGHILYRLRGHEGLERVQNEDLSMVSESGASGQECGWTPDGNYVFSGSQSGTIRFWHIPHHQEQPADAPRPMVQNVSPSVSREGHQGASRAVAFNPRSAMMVSGGSKVALWLPD
ncbi:WD40 repeat-like protein, partial [Acaromyces ingoldii]